MTLFGYGKTTQAIAKKFENVTIFDDKFTTQSKDEFGNTLLPSKLFDATTSSLEIPSPGIPPFNPLIQQAQNLISEYDLLFEDMPTSVWISGTNGKTTTTKMTQHILGDSSQMGGNVGFAVANMDTTKDIWILETSSFTLHYTNVAYPNIYILLPIKEDHISWHGSFEEYRKAKIKPLSLMREGDLAIVPKEFENVDTMAFKIVYENSGDIAKYFNIDISKIKFKDPFLMDALLAMAIDKILYDKIDYEKINSFEIEEHRLEELRDFRDRLWVNDTKATNVDATIWAIKAYKKQKIYLVLGGDDKGASLDPLFEEIVKYNIEVFTTGSNKKRVELFCKENNIVCTPKENLEDIVSLLATKLQADEVALLSPAASSLDEYSSYEARGNLFKELVKKLS